jgi:hypothetical protein
MSESEAQNKSFNFSAQINPDPFFLHRKRKFPEVGVEKLNYSDITSKKLNLEVVLEWDKANILKGKEIAWGGVDSFLRADLSAQSRKKVTLTINLKRKAGVRWVAIMTQLPEKKKKNLIRFCAFQHFRFALKPIMMATNKGGCL